MMSQKQVILDHMKLYGEISQKDANQLYSITRLADVIYKLKKDGVKIETEYKMVNTMYGKTKIAVYRVEQ